MTQTTTFILFTILLGKRGQWVSGYFSLGIHLIVSSYLSNYMFSLCWLVLPLRTVLSYCYLFHTRYIMSLLFSDPSYVGLPEVLFTCKCKTSLLLNSSYIPRKRILALRESTLNVYYPYKSKRFLPVNYSVFMIDYYFYYQPWMSFKWKMKIHNVYLSTSTRMLCLPWQKGKKSIF